ncbi:hypothetical protein GOBAR_AA31045 [Gossypium barbadense]|uniref:Uncharacterized protein n=1 Tax=Gossypium barbadense TaxID=3634 RepID=A0A2P5WEX2_GOSBA|nr:hypothetical protein GOBAR_AA31045 [Gossypium barbadense]
MDNKEIKILNKREDANEREVCVSDSQSSRPPYSADQPLVIYYDAMREPLKPQMSCEDFKRLLQDRMDNKEIKILNKREDANEREVCVSDSQSSRPPYSADQPLVIYYDAMREPLKPQMVIEVPSPFPYKDNKTVPWRYDVNIVTPEVEKSKAITEDVGEVGHFTRSGRCYSKEVEPVKKSSDSKQKGKTVMHEVEVE